MSFLADILASKRDEVRGLDGLSPDLDAAPAPRDFVSALRSPGGGLRVIAEIKRASPSEGPIRPDLDVLETAAAIELYNDLGRDQAVGGLFHSTC